MKPWPILALCLLGVSSTANAQATAWEPSCRQVQMPIWPGKPPGKQSVPGPETATVGKELLAGKPVTSVTNVTQPTLTVYAPQGKNTGAAVVVIPGGGFQVLAIDLEGTELCDWLTSSGITCVLQHEFPAPPVSARGCRRPRKQPTGLRHADLSRAPGQRRWLVEPQRAGLGQYATHVPGAGRG